MRIMSSFKQLVCRSAYTNSSAEPRTGGIFHTHWAGQEEPAAYPAGRHSCSHTLFPEVPSGLFTSPFRQQFCTDFLQSVCVLSFPPIVSPLLW